MEKKSIEETILGKSKKEAEKILKKSNLSMRIISEAQVYDSMYDENRVNVDVRKGKVIDVIGIG